MIEEKDDDGNVTILYNELKWWDECGGDEYNTWPNVTSVVNTNYFGVDDSDY